MTSALASKWKSKGSLFPSRLRIAESLGHTEDCPSENSLPSPDKVPHQAHRGFKTTRWTLVSIAGDGHADDQMAALEQLCESYRPAILAFLRSTGKSLEDAEDLTQQFFYQLLTNDTLSYAQASRGKFRSFLLACVSNFSRDQYQRAQTLKRGGGIQFELIDDEEPRSPDLTPDEAFDRKWAETIITQALTRLENEAREEGKPFEELKCYLVDSRGEVPFDQKAADMGISTPALKSAVYRLRQRYVTTVKAIVAETISPGDSIEEELQCLLAILSG